MSDAVTTPNPFEERIAKAAKVMAISTDDLWRYLDAMGIDKSDDGRALLEAETTREGDARALMVDGRSSTLAGKLPTLVKIARFSAGWAILKGKATEIIPTNCNSDIAQLVETIKRIEQRPNEELLKMYNQEASFEVIEELRKRSCDRPCIIFEDDGTVDQKNSLKLLRLAHRQETLPTFKVQRRDGSCLVRVHRVGDFPMNFVEECPIHGDIVLVEGQCEDCQDSWDGISSEDRVIVRVARDAGMLELEPAKICDLIERIRGEKGANFLLKRGAVGLRYRELKEEARLPILRRRVSRTAKSDPLFIHRQ